jgi:LuxR family maltose regulon positive regulatory protein
MLVTSLINRMATIPFDFALVLDNVHLIDALAARNALHDLVEYLPPRAHLVVSTREAPELPLPRMRVRRQCIELRDDDLAFTPRETAAFLREIRNLPIPQGQVDMIHTRTEGWATGVRLAAREIEECGECRQGVGSRIISGIDPQIVAWFEGEIFQRQPSDIAEFLLRTSTLDELTGAACDEVTGRADGRRMLDQLERRNLFLHPLDDDRSRYRYHTLFREFLRQRLRRAHRSPAALDGRPSGA